MTAAKPDSGFFGRLSPRERFLVSVLGVIALVLGAVVFVLAPGLDAVRTAESRRMRSAGELAIVQGTAAQLVAARKQGDATPIAGAATAIRDIGLEQFVQVLASSEEADGLLVRAEAPGTAQLLTFVETAAARAAMGVRSMSLERTPSGTIVGDIKFGRSAP